MLREKQITFCNEYVKCKNAALAAKRAGYTPDYGRALLNRDEIAEFCRKQEFEIFKKMGDVIEGTKLREIMEEKGELGADPPPKEKREKQPPSERERQSSSKKEKEGEKNPDTREQRHCRQKKEEGEGAAVKEKTALRKRIATADDVLSFLTEIMEGDEALRDRLRAAELLGKRYGLFKGTGGEEEDKCLVIVGEDRL